jgi:uncharacterized membrane protein
MTKSSVSISIRIYCVIVVLRYIVVILLREIKRAKYFQTQDSEKSPLWFENVQNFAFV